MTNIISGICNAGACSNKDHVGIHSDTGIEYAIAADSDRTGGSREGIRLRQNAGGNRSARIVERNVYVYLLALKGGAACALHEKGRHVHGSSAATNRVLGPMHDGVC